MAYTSRYFYWWPLFTLDRRAHWLSLGCSEEDALLKLRLSANTIFGTAIFATFATVASITFEPASVNVNFSGARTALAAANVAVMLAAWSIDVYGTPPPSRDSDPRAVMSTIGPLAYFTKQSLAIQLTHATLSMLAEASLAIGRYSCFLSILAAVHDSACMVAAIALALTLLFLRLNWFEAQWRRENLVPWLKRGVCMNSVMLLSHLLSTPVAILDVALIKRPALLGSMAAVASRSCILLVSYVAFYISLTCLNFRWCRRYPYPFMRHFTTTRHWLLFALVIIVFLTGFVLPVVLFTKSLNRDMFQ